MTENMKLKIAQRIATVSQEMQDIAEEFEGKRITGDQAETFEGLHAELKELRDQHDALGLSEKMFEMANTPGGSVEHNTTPDPSAQVKSLAEQILGPRDEYKGAAHWQVGDMHQAAMESKTTVTSSNAGALVVPDYRGLVDPISRQMSVRDAFFTPGSTVSNTINYVTLTTDTNNAAGVAEGGTKPEGALAFTATETTVRKVAENIPVSKEMLEDYAQMQSFIENRLMYHVDYEEEIQLLWGAASPDLVGIMNTSGVQALTGSSDPAFETGDTYYDIIRKLIYMASWGGSNENTPPPTTVMYSPLIGMEMDLQKDSNSNYIWLVINGRVWGMTASESKALIDPDDTNDHYILVGSRAAGQIWDREGMNVEVGYIDDQFVKNTKTILAEKRLAMGLYYPASFAYYNAENIS